MSVGVCPLSSLEMKWGNGAEFPAWQVTYKRVSSSPALGSLGVSLMSQGYDDIKEALMKSIYLTRSQIYTSFFHHWRQATNIENRKRSKNFINCIIFKSHTFPYHAEYGACPTVKYFHTLKTLKYLKNTKLSENINSYIFKGPPFRSFIRHPVLQKVQPCTVNYPKLK